MMGLVVRICVGNKPKKPVMRMCSQNSHNLIPVIYETGYISMLGSVNYKGLYTCSGSRHIQVGINVIQVAATIFVIPETPKFVLVSYNISS